MVMLSDHQPAKPRRSRARPMSPSLDSRMLELEGKVDDVDKKVEGVIRNQELATQAMRRAEELATQAMQRVESKMDAILLLVGAEEEDGDGGFKGVGLLGRMRRVEESQTSLLSKYKMWIAWGGGFLTCGTAMTVFIWWLISDKLELVLKGTAQ